MTGPMIDANAHENKTRPRAAPRSSNIFLRITIVDVTYPPKVNPKTETQNIWPRNDVHTWLTNIAWEIWKVKIRKEKKLIITYTVHSRLRLPWRHRQHFCLQIYWQKHPQASQRRPFQYNLQFPSHWKSSWPYLLRFHN